MTMSRFSTIEIPFLREQLETLVSDEILSLVLELMAKRLGAIVEKG